MNAVNVHEKKLRRMIETPVEKLVLTLAVPTIISMLITSFYNIADTFFVGKIGTAATAAVGVAFPLMSMIQALGFLFGHGSGNFISRALGAKDVDSSTKMASTAFFSALLAGGALGALGLIFLDPLVSMLGATETIRPFARQYVSYILIGAPYMTASLVLNNQLRFQGSAMYGMIGVLTGAVINIGLDPLFIFQFNMGVAGAALATIISQFVGFVLLLAGTRFGGNLAIKWSNFKPNMVLYKEMFRGGVPSLCRQGLGSIAGISLNLAAGPYGDAAIAAMSIVSRIMFFALSAVLGLGQGFQPVCGFNYGAKKYARVRRAFFFSVLVSLAAILVFCAAGYLWSDQLIALFRADDPQVIAIGSVALRWQLVLFPTVSWVIITNMLLQTIGKAFKASLLGMARQGLFFFPVVLILPHFMGIMGVQISQPIADALSFLLSIPMGIAVLREIRQQERATPETNHSLHSPSVAS